jgi:hypothetical protein
MRPTALMFWLLMTIPLTEPRTSLRKRRKSILKNCTFSIVPKNKAAESKTAPFHGTSFLSALLYIAAFY